MRKKEMDSEVEEEEAVVEAEAEVVEEEEDSAVEADAEEAEEDTEIEIITDHPTVEEKPSILTYKTKKLNKKKLNDLDHTIDYMRFLFYVTNKLSNYNYLNLRFLKSYLKIKHIYFKFKIQERCIINNNYIVLAKLKNTMCLLFLKVS